MHWKFPKEKQKYQRSKSTKFLKDKKVDRIELKDESTTQNRQKRDLLQIKQESLKSSLKLPNGELTLGQLSERQADNHPVCNMPPSLHSSFLPAPIMGQWATDNGRNGAWKR